MCYWRSLKINAKNRLWFFIGTHLVSMTVRRGACICHCTKVQRNSIFWGRFWVLSKFLAAGIQTWSENGRLILARFLAPSLNVDSTRPDTFITVLFRCNSVSRLQRLGLPRQMQGRGKHDGYYDAERCTAWMCRRVRNNARHHHHE